MKIIDKTNYTVEVGCLTAGAIFSDPEDGSIWMKLQEADAEECYCVKFEDGCTVPFAKDYHVSPRHGKLTVWSEATE